ncbi:MAG TPA: HPr family phosphocarrier protein [Myxococcota bacterium]|jgi:phosphocarrier protein|nr:HPr family phosphocarrier protein [Myxococcota bacterium]
MSDGEQPAGGALRRTCRIRNRLGMHARSAAAFVQTATRFRCEVWVERDTQRVNGKSIMGVLMLAASKGTQITVETAGEDAAPALEALGDLVDNGFGEPT